MRRLFASDRVESGSWVLETSRSSSDPSSGRRLFSPRVDGRVEGPRVLSGAFHLPNGSLLSFKCLSSALRPCWKIYRSSVVGKLALRAFHGYLGFFSNAANEDQSMGNHRFRASCNVTQPTFINRHKVFPDIGVVRDRSDTHTSCSLSAAIGSKISGTGFRCGGSFSYAKSRTLMPSC